MKYDVIIIGGGLSGLIAGIKLVKRGFSVAIVSNGQSALHFYSGSLGLLSKINDEVVENPIEAIDRLPETHPYRKIGKERIPMLAEEAKMLLSEAGLTFTGSHVKNHYRLTPFGMCEPTWLTLTDYAICMDPSEMGGKHTKIVNFKGYLDFFTGFLEEGLRRHGLECSTAEIDVPEVTRLIKNSSETRATTIARALTGRNLETLAAHINRVAGDADVVLMPAVVGLESEQPIRQLREMVIPKLMCVPTLPLSVCGTRSQICLRRYFEKLGGVYFLGDKVVKGFFDSNRMREVETANMENLHLRADHFILATGGLFSQGLLSTPDTVYEPVLGAQVIVKDNRDEWCSRNILDAQPYMEFGVDTTDDLKIKINGETIDNVYAIGSVLGGAMPVKEGSGGGIAIFTALHVANNLNKFAHIREKLATLNQTED